MSNTVISIIGDGGFWVARIRGEIDSKTSPGVRTALREVLQSGHVQGLVVDLEDVIRIDSSGLAILLEAFHDAQSRKARFILCGAGEAVLRMLSVTRLIDFLEIAESIEEALRRLDVDCACLWRRGLRKSSNAGDWGTRLQ